MSEQQPGVIEEVKIGEWLVMRMMSNGDTWLIDSITKHGIRLTAKEALGVYDVLLRQAKLFEEGEKQQEAT